MHFIFDSGSTQRTCVGMHFVLQRMNSYGTYTKSKFNKWVPYILSNISWKIYCLYMIRLKMFVKIKSITCISLTLPVLPALVNESLQCINKLTSWTPLFCHTYPKPNLNNVVQILIPQLFFPCLPKCNNIKSSNTNARVMAFVLSLALDPTFGIHSHKTLDTAQPCHLLKPKWKPSSSHSISTPTNTQFLLQSLCACECVHVCVRISI